MDDSSKDAFALYDRDQDGKIAVHELGTVIRACGRNPTNADIEAWIKEFVGERKEVDYGTVAKCLAKPKTKADNSEEVKEAFKIFDKDNNGQVQVSELRHVLTTLGEKMTTAEVDELLKDAKVDKDGNINYNTLVSMIMPKQ